MQRKRDIKPIEEKSKRNTTFTKRRQGLFKKTKMFCDRAGDKAAVVVFSNAGNCFVEGHPHVEQVIDRYFADQPVEASIQGECEAAALPPTEMETRFTAAMATGQPPWDELMRGLGLRELGELEQLMKNIKRMVADRPKEDPTTVAGEGASS